MILILVLEYIGHKSQTLARKQVNIMWNRPALDNLMNYFRIYWNMQHHTECVEVLCTYKTFSSKQNNHI